MTWDGLTPPYSTIVADPPWAGYGGLKGNPDRHYSTMPLEDICRLSVGTIADESCHLWLWGTNGRMADALAVVRAWGFETKGLLTWCKPGPGVGYYLRHNTEHVVFAVRGRPMVPESAYPATWFEAPRGSHSSKPAKFFDIVRQVSPGPYAELFSREPQLGWDHWGFGYEQGDRDEVGDTATGRDVRAIEDGFGGIEEADGGTDSGSDYGLADCAEIAGQIRLFENVETGDAL